MKYILPALLIVVILFSCETRMKIDDNVVAAPGIQGTWHLLSGRTVTGKDTVFVDYTKDQKMIKIINATHFAFLRHDLNHGKSGEAVYSAGGGTYKLEGDKYSENLEYFNDRNWEGHSFHFTVKMIKDTLFQSGIEKIDSLGINQEILETYVRVGN